MWWQPETGSGTRRKDSGSWATAVWSVSSECDVEFSPHDMAVVIPTPWNVGSSKCASGGGGCGDPSPDSKGGTRGSGGDSGSGYSRLLRDLFAGAFTGGFTKTAVAPLERVKVILQLQVWNASSLATVFRGRWPFSLLCSVVPFSGHDASAGTGQEVSRHLSDSADGQ
jgi:hypothetical protein